MHLWKPPNCTALCYLLWTTNRFSELCKHSTLTLEGHHQPAHGPSSWRPTHLHRGAAASHGWQLGHITNGISLGAACVSDLVARPAHSIAVPAGEQGTKPQTRLGRCPKGPPRLLATHDPPGALTSRAHPAASADIKDGGCFGSQDGGGAQNTVAEKQISLCWGLCPGCSFPSTPLEFVSCICDTSVASPPRFFQFLV